MRFAVLCIAVPSRVRQKFGIVWSRLTAYLCVEEFSFGNFGD